MKSNKRTKAQISTTAIERIYITMRHLFIRGFYKPMGVSGQALINELLILQPEIYGSMGEEGTELEGLLYIFDRLPEGIAECRFIHLTADEGLGDSNFQKIIPAKRRRNCYRIDRDQLNIEITRGRSDVYDILTHLTFMFIEADKIAKKVMIGDDGRTIREWQHLENVVLKNTHLVGEEREVLVAHLSSILGRSFEETFKADANFSTEERPDRLFEVIYWMGKLALNEILEDKKHEITFSAILRDRIGHHRYGDDWAQNIKLKLHEKNLLHRPLHIISANMHSVMNSIYAPLLLQEEAIKHEGTALYELIGDSSNKPLRKKIKKGARSHGLTFIKDSTGANIDVQIIDTQEIDFDKTRFSTQKRGEEMPVLIVMDYAFGEQAYETLDELLKPFRNSTGEKTHLNVESV